VETVDEQPKDAEAVIQDETVEQPEVSIEELQKQIEELKSDNQALVDKVDKSEGAYKGLQRTHNKAVQEGKITQGLDGRMTSIEARLDEVSVDTADLIVKELQARQQFNSDFQPETTYQQTTYQPESAIEKRRKELAEKKESSAKTNHDSEKATLEQQLFVDTADTNGLFTDGELNHEFIEWLNKTVPDGDYVKAAKQINPFLKSQSDKSKADEEKLQVEKEAAEKLEKEQEEARQKGEDVQPVGNVAGTGGLTDDRAFMQAAAKGETTDWKRMSALTGVPLTYKRR